MIDEDFGADFIFFPVYAGSCYREGGDLVPVIFLQVLQMLIQLVSHKSCFVSPLAVGLDPLM
ncbi:MAG TPA: hypothetical protein O0X71_04300, partial [Methanocorpusculum sp.]|nr:hypothetical protein [Methanocorpusculum sp.]